MSVNHYESRFRFRTQFLLQYFVRLHSWAVLGGEIRSKARVADAIGVQQSKKDVKKMRCYCKLVNGNISRDLLWPRNTAKILWKINCLFYILSSVFIWTGKSVSWSSIPRLGDIAQLNMRHKRTINVTPEQCFKRAIWIPGCKRHILSFTVISWQPCAMVMNNFHSCNGKLLWQMTSSESKRPVKIASSFAARLRIVAHRVRDVKSIVTSQFLFLHAYFLFKPEKTNQNLSQTDHRVKLKFQLHTQPFFPTN